ncbi:MAG: CDP-alcohol phosphatidyltransferase family protein [Campylobacterales bacterium]|nr:CDP-alcohol phosphatidyltransferase family protein [Campylobacterales bacterium]
MTIYDLKPKFQALLKPIVKKLYEIGITPNQVTIGALLLSFLGGFIVFLAQKNHLLLIIIPFIMFIRMALNAIDGILAKEYNLTSDTGAILNELGDVLSDILLYLPFIFILNPLILIAFVILAILSEFTGVLYQAIFGKRRYNGPMGKSDRAFVIGLISVLLAFSDKALLFSNILLALSVFLLFLTLFNRLKR